MSARPRRTEDTGRPSGRSSAADKVRLQRELAARRRRDRRILVIVAVAVVALIVGGGLSWQAWRVNRSPEAAQGPTGSPVAIESGRPIVLGPASAPVSIRLFEDFHCPHCAEFAAEFGPVIEELQTAGQAKVELYPMAFIDDGSANASNAMACAAEAGFGPAYYNGLFANSTLAWSDDQLLDLAGQVSDTVPDSFRSCVTERAHADWVASIDRAASAAGVTSTPTVFVDDQRVDLAALTLDGLRAQVQAAGT